MPCSRDSGQSAGVWLRVEGVGFNRALSLGRVPPPGGELGARSGSAVEHIWRIYDSQGHVLALALSQQAHALDEPGFEPAQSQHMALTVLYVPYSLFDAQVLKTFQGVTSSLGSGVPPRAYLTQSVFRIILQKSTPPQIRQRILYYY